MFPATRDLVTRLGDAVPMGTRFIAIARGVGAVQAIAAAFGGRRVSRTAGSHIGSLRGAIHVRPDVVRSVCRGLVLVRQALVSVGAFLIVQGSGLIGVRSRLVGICQRLVGIEGPQGIGVRRAGFKPALAERIRSVAEWNVLSHASTSALRRMFALVLVLGEQLYQGSTERRRAHQPQVARCEH